MTADIVVVGAGVVGASIGYQIARRSDLKVLVVDKAAGPAEGSTGASSAISRCRYTLPEVVRLAYHGQRAYGDWASFTGLDEPRCRLNRVGVVWMLGHAAAEVDLEVSRLRGQGADVERIDAERLAELFPALSSCGIRVDPRRPGAHECASGEAFLFEPTGGYADPVGATQDLIEAARLAGAEVRFRSGVVGVRRSGERVTGVELEDGTQVDSGLVVNAAGPWCTQINSLADVANRWTLITTRVQVLYRGWPSDLGPLPVTVDGSTQIYFRPDGQDRVLVGSTSEEDESEAVDNPDDFKRSPDGSFRALKMAAFHHRVPNLAARGEITGVAGLYTVNREDVHPILGPSGVEGFWLANGFSGHGFKLAPMIGSMIAQALTGEKASHDTDVDMGIFAVDRVPIPVAAKNVLA